LSGTSLSEAKRRLALQQLGRERLSELTTRYDLAVEDRRVLDQHVDALVRSRSVDFQERGLVLVYDATPPNIPLAAEGPPASPPGPKGSPKKRRR
jgi:hypothetical protein